MRASSLFWIAVGGVLLASRLAHTTILWADEDYHLAAAIQLLHGKTLYRDLWYDKPPLSALWPLLWGAWPGWPLRIVSAATVLAACRFAFLLAARLWTPREGFAAAGMVAFYSVFYFAHSTIPVEPDTLLMLPHLAAVYWAAARKPFAAGVAAGLGFLLTPKGAAVLAACFLFHPSGWRAMLSGFAIPNAAAAAWLVGARAWSGYLEQVWRWGLLYAGLPPTIGPAPLARLAGWLGFHAALAIGVVLSAVRRRPAMRGPWVVLAAWFAISLAAAAIGWRLVPRYLNQILPPLAIAAAPGLAWLWSERRRARVALVLTAAVLAVPVVRFGPRYFQLAYEAAFAGGVHDWVDVYLDQESRRAARLVDRIARPGDTIFIWGYRPNIVAYTRLPVASRYWESQPLTGVAADRHLYETRPLDAAWAARNRREAVRGMPAIVVDGLSRINPALDIHSFPEMAEWMRQYCQVAEDTGIVVYRRCASLP
jgi:hypothetical protein